jgi:hypothetical protein
LILTLNPPTPPQLRNEMLEYHLRPQDHVVVPEPQHPESQPTQIVVALAVLFRPRVLPAIHLDHDARRDADEIDHVAIERMLAAKVQACEPAGAQSRPQLSFRVGHARAQFARESSLRACAHTGALAGPHAGYACAETTGIANRPSIA